MRHIKSFGQNFLINPGLAEKFVTSSNPQSSDTYIEIGPGKGALTFLLAPKIKSLVCVEIDSFLASQLQQKFNEKDINNVEIVNQNVLAFDPTSKGLDQYKIIGSLPYNISKMIINKFLTLEANRPSEMYLLIQKEVAENMTAEAPNSTFLSTFIKIYGDCKKLFNVGKNNFAPVPKVDGTVIKISLKLPEPNHKELARFSKILYSSPRKTIRNNLKALNTDESNFQGIDLNLRPSQLSFEQVKTLFMMYNSDNKCHEQK